MSDLNSLCKSAGYAFAGSNPALPTTPHTQGVTKQLDPEVDASPTPVKAGGHKMVTNGGAATATARKQPKRPATGKPHATVKFGSAVVPIYRTTSGGRT